MVIVDGSLYVFIFWAAARLVVRYVNFVISRYCGDGFFRIRYLISLDGGVGSGDRFLFCFLGYSFRCVENRCVFGRRTWCGRGN